mmetsp:Transcript_42245/g.96853  ORF Transcript_42245/g.96853 Transcript_42245/m.96853 type:complete len:94 (+) Transcript_42245:136-417(+)
MFTSHDLRKNLKNPNRAQINQLFSLRLTTHLLASQVSFSSAERSDCITHLIDSSEGSCVRSFTCTLQCTFVYTSQFIEMITQAPSSGCSWNVA